MFTASTMEGEKKWKKRRLALAKAERMRAAKKLRDETSAAISPIADLTPTSTSPVTVSLSPEPGPSGLQQEVSVAVATSNEGGIFTDDGVRRARAISTTRRHRVCSTTRLLACVRTTDY